MPAAAAEIHNVGTLAASIKEADKIPQAFLQPENERPTVPFDGYTEEEALPVVDMAALLSGNLEDRQKIASDILKAASEWGFFQVINHSIPLELISKLRSVGRSFFLLPAEEKEKASLGLFQGYEGKHGYLPAKVPWSETCTLQIAPVPNVEPIIQKLWPDGNHEMSSTILEYGNAAHELGKSILELLAESLGLQTHFFRQHFDQTYAAGMRLNYYPPCPLPDQILGLGAHADPNCLTILYQDEVGGLQIEKDGKWIAVKPHIDSLVLNVGDSLQAWSNGRLRSVQHRAVVNGSKARLSVAFFYSPDQNAVMEAPEELIDEEHPRSYRPFTWTEYLHQIRTKRMKGKGGLDVYMKIGSEEELAA